MNELKHSKKKLNTTKENNFMRQRHTEGIREIVRKLTRQGEPRMKLQ